MKDTSLRDTVQKREYGKLRPRDPPSIFACVKPSLLPTVPPSKRPTSRSSSEARNMHPDELATFEARDRLKTFSILRDEITSHDFGMPVNCMSIMMEEVGRQEIRIQSVQLLSSNGSTNVYSSDL